MLTITQKSVVQVHYMMSCQVTGMFRSTSVQGMGTIVCLQKQRLQYNYSHINGKLDAVGNRFMNIHHKKLSIYCITCIYVSYLSSVEIQSLDN